MIAHLRPIISFKKVQPFLALIACAFLSYCGGPPQIVDEPEGTRSISPTLLSANGDSLPSGQPFIFPEPEIIDVESPTSSRIDSSSYSNDKLEYIPLEAAGNFELPLPIESIRPSEDPFPLPYIEHSVSPVESGSVTPPTNFDPLSPNRRYLNETNGLPSQQIRDAVMEEDGTLWLSTLEGLVRYDGKNHQLWIFDQLSSPTFIHWEQMQDGWLWGGQENVPDLLAFDGSRLRVYPMDSIRALGENWQSYSSSDQRFLINDKQIFYFDGKLMWVFPKPENYDKTFGFYRFEQGSLVRYEIAEELIQAFPDFRLRNLTPTAIEADDQTLCLERDGRLHCTRTEDVPFVIWRLLPPNEIGSWVQSSQGQVAHWGKNAITYYRSGAIESYPNFPYISSANKYGQVWLRSRLSGLKQFQNRVFRHYQQIELGASQPYGISAMLEAKEGDLWLGSHGGPLLRIHDEQWWRYSFPDEKSTIRALTGSTSYDLWMGSSTDGLFAKLGSQVLHYDLLPTEEESIYSLTADQKDNLWIGFGHQGLARFDGDRLWWYKHQEEEEAFGTSNTIRALLCDREGHIWAASQGGGLRRFDGQKFTYYTTKEGLSSNKLVSLYEDSRGQIWIGTSDAGVMVYDGQKFISYSTEDGLSSNTIYTISEDANGYIWLGADDCLNRLDFEIEQDPGLPNFVQGLGLTIGVICDLDGARNDEFFANASTLDQDGTLWWGAARGLHVCHTDDIFLQEEPPGLRLVDIEIAAKSYSFQLATDNHQTHVYSDQGQIRFDSLSKRTSLPLGLNLPTRLNAISFQFSPTNHPRKENSQYSFRLLNAENDWSEAKTTPSVEYRGLAPGQYTLEARIAGRNSIWSEPFRFPFSIRFPWWQRGWALMIWASLLLIVAYRIYRFILLRRLRLADAERVLELDELKNRFYTNITHEFRTPLTVILGMNERIDGNPQAKTLIRRNANNLLRLINQLLDLSRLDAGTLQPKMIQGDIVAYCRYLTESLYSLAEEKRQRLAFFTEEEEIVMDYDTKKVQYILFNLLSNAIKFTPKGGQIVVNLKREKEQLRLLVKDNGPGIAPDKLPYIFDRFYQVEDRSTRSGEGSGIGLAFTKELVELLGGTITINSVVGKGTSAGCLLPIKRVAPVLENNFIFSPLGKSPMEKKTSSSEDFGAKDNFPTLLLVEDNADLIAYVKNLLADRYQMLVARDGQEGIALATEQVPDIIVSDVMMPEMDGFEMCERLKQDLRTSHIPIILLTAKSTQADKIQGLKYGADAYLAKPFNEQELGIRIKNLIDLRKSLQRRFALGEQALLASNDLENQFLNDASAFVKSQLDNAQLSIPEMAQAMAMSQTQLYRKLKALTAQTPSQFVRQVRLEEGKRLLRKSELTIAEIAYAVGFSDPNYFSRTFNDAFGKSPSDYRKLG
ncbi:MAG: ATP-binding protein [Bacteroidota bacterium]